MPEQVSSIRDVVYKPQGQLESRHAEVQPLPTTPITAEAQQKLFEWGVPEEFVDTLRELTSSLRYDLCSQKAQRIAERGGYIVKGYEIILPNFFDSNARLDGQCGDIAVQLISLLHFSGFLSKLNEYLEQSRATKIKLCFVEGQSRTHFNSPDAYHAWVGLLERDASLDELVTVDPSFQEISILRNNGYIMNGMVIDIQSFSNMATAARIMIGSYMEFSNGTFVAMCDNDYVLGRSSDFKFVYGFSFLKDSRTQKILPIVKLMPEQTEDEEIMCVVGRDGSIKWDNLNTSVTEIHRKEVEEILSQLQKINLVENDQAADEALAGKMNIRY